MKFSLRALLAVILLGCAESLPDPPDLAERLAPYQEGPTTDVPLQEVVDTILRDPFSRVFALTLTGRVVAWVPTEQINAVAVVDESSEVRLRGTITEKDVTGSYNVVAGMAFYTRRLFSMRVGAGYGRFILPSLGFVYLETGLVIDFAAVFRF